MYSGHKLNAVNCDLKLKPESVEGELQFDASSWFQAKPALKELNPLMNLPYLLDTGDVVISQSNACFLYLGRKLNMLGDSTEDLSRCEQLLCEVMDLRNKVTGFAYNPSSTKDTGVALLKDVTGKNGIIPKLELWLLRQTSQGYSGTFFVGDKASAPDFHLWEMLDQLSFTASYYEQDPLLSSFPALYFFKQSFEKLPGNANYFASKLASLPFNNKSAKFGATITGDAWKLGIDYDTDTSGLY